MVNVEQGYERRVSESPPAQAAMRPPRTQRPTHPLPVITDYPILREKGPRWTKQGAGGQGARGRGPGGRVVVNVAWQDNSGAGEVPCSKRLRRYEYNVPPYSCWPPRLHPSPPFLFAHLLLVRLHRDGGGDGYRLALSSKDPRSISHAIILSAQSSHDV